MKVRKFPQTQTFTLCQPEYCIFSNFKEKKHHTKLNKILFQASLGVKWLQVQIFNSKTQIIFRAHHGTPRVPFTPTELGSLSFFDFVGETEGSPPGGNHFRRALGSQCGTGIAVATRRRFWPLPADSSDFFFPKFFWRVFSFFSPSGFGGPSRHCPGGGGESVPVIGLVGLQHVILTKGRNLEDGLGGELGYPFRKPDVFSIPKKTNWCQGNDKLHISGQIIIFHQPRFP